MKRVDQNVIKFSLKWQTDVFTYHRLDNLGAFAGALVNFAISAGPPKSLDQRPSAIAS